MDTILLIPIYQPNESSVRFLSTLDTSSFLKVIVIDDGSGTKYKETFDKIRAIDNVEVISYSVNHGKGHALKVGLNEVQDHYPLAHNIVTADGDGQHLSPDIMKVAKEGEAHPENVYLGSRDFTSVNVPKKSRFGNRFSAFYFRIMSKKKISDTQTGLRSYPISSLDTLISTEGERYEYEMNCLFALAPTYPFIELPITTVYENNNKASHFRAIRDSVRIYKMPLEYVAVALTSSLLDFGAYYLLNTTLNYGLFGSIALSTVIARLFSGIYNFSLLFGLVYRGRSSLKGSAIRYLVLFLINMCLSFSLVYAFSLWTGFLSIIIKLFVEFLIFLLDFFFTSTFVFIKKQKRKKAL